MKFDQLIECNLRNIFLEKLNTKYRTETSPRPISEKKSWAYLSINTLKLYTICFYCMANWRLSKYIETKLQSTCVHLTLSFFKKWRGLELVTLPHFPYNFWRKIILSLCSINWPNFIVWLLSLCEILDIMCIGIVCKPVVKLILSF